MRTDFTKETIRAIHFVDLHEVKIYDAYSHNYYILISPTTIQCVIFDRNIFVKTRVVIKISHHHLLGYIFCKEYTDDRSQTPNNAIRDKSIYYIYIMNRIRETTYIEKRTIEYIATSCLANRRN